MTQANDNKVEQLRLVVDSTDSSYFRHLADEIDAGRITSFAFIAESIDREIKFSYAGPRWSHTLGLASRLIHIMHKTWDSRVS